MIQKKLTSKHVNKNDMGSISVSVSRGNVSERETIETSAAIMFVDGINR